MSRLTRFLDQEFARGQDHARRGLRRDPGSSEAWSKYQRWAYDAGYAQGLAVVKEMAAHLAAVTIGDAGASSATSGEVGQ